MKRAFLLFVLFGLFGAWIPFNPELFDDPIIREPVFPGGKEFMLPFVQRTISASLLTEAICHESDSIEST